MRVLPPATGRRTGRVSNRHQLSLDGLAPVDRQRLLPHLESACRSLKRETINKPGQPIEQLYFPTAGIVSLIALLDEGAAVEVGIIGREGWWTPVPWLRNRLE